MVLSPFMVLSHLWYYPIYGIFLLISFAKLMQTSAMKACFQIAECSLTSAKLMQTSAMAKKSSQFIYCAI